MGVDIFLHSEHSEKVNHWIAEYVLLIANQLQLKPIRTENVLKNKWKGQFYQSHFWKKN